MYTLYASYHPRFLRSEQTARYAVPIIANGQLHRPNASDPPVEITVVEDWDHAEWWPEASARSRLFALPPPAPDGPPGIMRLTITRETMGSTRYPAMYSLAIDVLDHDPEPTPRFVSRVYPMEADGADAVSLKDLRGTHDTISTFVMEEEGLEGKGFERSEPRKPGKMRRVLSRILRPCHTSFDTGHVLETDGSLIVMIRP